MCDRLNWAAMQFTGRTWALSQLNPFRRGSQGRGIVAMTSRPPPSNQASIQLTEPGLFTTCASVPRRLPGYARKWFVTARSIRAARSDGR